MGGWHPPRLSMPHRKSHKKERPVKADVTGELEEGLQALDEAVAQEPPRKAAAPPPPPPEPEPVLQPAEDEVRESLMDRRVRRVLELSREGRSVTAIAEELQMGQDEVKLILDLNQ
jgi:DNA-binding NarL/FixJ family response regulator